MRSYARRTRTDCLSFSPQCLPNPSRSISRTALPIALDVIQIQNAMRFSVFGFRYDFAQCRLRSISRMSRSPGRLAREDEGVEESHGERTAKVVLEESGS